MNKLVAWVRIARPPIILISCLGVLVGALNTSAYLPTEGVIELSFFQISMIILGAAALAAGLMIHNDVTDLKSDKVNRPHKPIPSGKILTREARPMGIGLMILSIIIASLLNYKDTGEINWRCGIFTLTVVAVGLYYNYYGKYHGIFGNIAVAYGVGAIPFWGAIAIAPDHLLLMFPLAFAIFIQEIGREIMVNAGDYNGDLKAGYKTLPVLIGRKKAMYVALIFYLAFVPLYPIPYFGWFGAEPALFGPFYLAGATIFVLALLSTWILTYRIVLQGNEKRIWQAFERYERTGTRLMVIFFQIMLLLEAFY